MEKNLTKKEIETKIDVLNKEAKEFKIEYNSIDNSDKKAKKELNQKIAQINSEILTCKRMLKNINNVEQKNAEKEDLLDEPESNDVEQETTEKENLSDESENNNAEQETAEKEDLSDEPENNNTEQKNMTEDEYAAYMEEEYLKFEKKMEEQNKSDSAMDEPKENSQRDEEISDPTKMDNPESDFKHDENTLNLDITDNDVNTQKGPETKIEEGIDNVLKDNQDRVKKGLGGIILNTLKTILSIITSIVTFIPAIVIGFFQGLNQAAKENRAVNQKKQELDEAYTIDKHTKKDEKKQEQKLNKEKKLEQLEKTFDKKKAPKDKQAKKIILINEKIKEQFPELIKCEENELSSISEKLNDKQTINMEEYGIDGSIRLIDGNIELYTKTQLANEHETEIFMRQLDFYVKSHSLLDVEINNLLNKYKDFDFETFKKKNEIITIEELNAKYNLKNHCFEEDNKEKTTKQQTYENKQEYEKSAKELDDFDER